jgi:LAO/AO transport system kinase
VAQPASGDTIQYLKSGIIEIPDVFAVNKSDLGAPAHKTASEIGRSAPRQDRRDDWDYPVCLVSATMNSGIKELHGHFARHRSFLADAGLLDKLRTRHQSAWGSAGIERGVRNFWHRAGRAAMLKSAGASRKHLAINSKNVERMRQQIISRFKSSD